MEEETQAARLERLGRMRPEMFKSFISELAFVTSIMLSIMMAVRTNLHRVAKFPMHAYDPKLQVTNQLRVGILHLGLQCYHCDNNALSLNLSSRINVAGKRLHPCGMIVLLNWRPFGRYVRSFLVLHWRFGVACGLVPRCRFRPERNHHDHMSSSPGFWTSLFSPSFFDAYIQSLSSWSAKEHHLQHIRCMCSGRFLPRNCAGGAFQLIT